MMFGCQIKVGLSKLIHFPMAISSNDCPFIREVAVGMERGISIFCNYEAGVSFSEILLIVNFREGQ